MGSMCIFEDGAYFCTRGHANTRTISNRFHSRKFVPIVGVAVVMLDLRSAAILLLAALVAILVLVVASALYQGRRTSTWWLR